MLLPRNDDVRPGPMNQLQSQSERSPIVLARSPSATSSWIRPLVLAILVSLTVTTLILLHDQPTIPSVRRNPAIGKPAPHLDLIRLASTTAIVPAKIDLGGNVTLLHLWGTWCAPCTMEYPQLSQAAQELSSHSQFQFISVSCEGCGRETFEELRTKTNDYFRNQNVDSAAYADPRGLTRRSLVERLDQTDLYFPTSVLIDAQGNIAGVWQGYSEDSVTEITAMANQLAAYASSAAGCNQSCSQ